MFSELIPCHFNGSRDDFQGLFVTLEVWGETTLIADGSVITAFGQYLFERMESLGAHPQGLGKRFGADGHNHKFLKIDVIVGVFAAIENVHHRHRQNTDVTATEIAI